MHGQRCPRYSTKKAQTLIDNLKIFSQFVRPGETPPLDLIPVLKFVPERWAPWKTTLKDLRKRQRDYYFGLMDETKARMQRGEGNGCFMQEILERQKELKLTDEMTLSVPALSPSLASNVDIDGILPLRYMGASMLEAGSDTSASFLQNANQLLVAHPEVQKKAREELDRVIGPDRLPLPEDAENLLYVNAIIEEVRAWCPRTVNIC